MINIENDGNVYPIPEGWNEVNLKMFTEMVKLEENKSNFKITTLYNVELVSILGVPKDILMKIDTQSYSEIINSLDWVSVLPNNDNEIGKLTIEGVDYYLPKNLNKLSMGESITIEILIQDNAYDMLKMAAVFLRPEGEEFDSDRMEEREKLFGESVMITDLIKFNNSFINGAIPSLETTKGSSEKL